MNGTIEYAYQRFAIERFPLPTTAELESLERRMKVELPADFRQYLLDYNGGWFDENDIRSVEPDMPQAGLDVMFGLHSSHPYHELGDSFYPDSLTTTTR